MYLYSLFATLVCTALAYGYPAWASFKAVDSDDPLLHTQWLVYWIVIAVFTVFEMLLENVVMTDAFNGTLCQEKTASLLLLC